MLLFVRGRAVERIEAKAVAKEVFKGRVDRVTDGIAFVTLFTENGEPISAQWPERDLAKESIGQGDLIELTMTDMSGVVTSSFRKLARKTIPDDLWEEIERVKSAYANLEADPGDGEEED